MSEKSPEDQVVSAPRNKRPGSGVVAWKILLFFISTFALLGVAMFLPIPLVSSDPNLPGPFIRAVSGAIGMGAIGIVPGICWILFELLIARLNPEDPQGAIKSARRVTSLYAILGLLSLGLLGVSFLNAIIAQLVPNAPMNQAEQSARLTLWGLAFLVCGSVGGRAGAWASCAA